MTRRLVRAAGGLVVDAEGRLLLVHRPRYGDWTFPKGKVDPGEALEDCAIREVWEETGCRCTLGDLVAVIEYRDQKDRPKTVHYWAMRPIDDTEGSQGAAFEPNDEVDRIAWLRPEKAAEALSYERDRDVLAAFLDG